MIPCSSPRSSGWRATDWIIELKMEPIPMPAPREPRPMPRARPMALPAFVTGAAASRLSTTSSLVGGLDRRADVDSGQGGEDVGLDADDDDHLEEVEDGCRRDREHGQRDRLQDEHQADEDQD